MTVLREKGAVALTANEIARAAEVKPALVHYYFRTIDDLVLVLIRALAENGREAMEQLRERRDPAATIWGMELSSNIGIAVKELAVLASHREDARAEIMHAIENMRALQAEAIVQAFADRSETCPIPPLAASVILSAVARQIGSERTYGVSLGHAETIAFVERMLATHEPNGSPHTGAVFG